MVVNVVYHDRLYYMTLKDGNIAVYHQKLSKIQ